MRFIKRVVVILWVITLFVFSCLLYLRNPDPVSLDLVWVQLAEESLAVIIIAVFFVGLITGIFLTFAASVLSARTLKSNG